MRLTRLHSLRALRHPAYAAVWAGAFVSNVGTWMETLALGIHVARTTGQAAWTGAVVALTFVPGVVLGPLAGAMADRWDRRRLLMGLTLVQATLAGALALLAFLGHLSIPVVAVVSFLAGCASCLLSPSYNALLGELVPAEDFLSALALSSMQFNLGRIIGPTLAAAVIAWGGVPWALGLNAISFFAVLFAVQKLPVQVEPVAHASSTSRLPLLQGVREGLRAVHSDKALGAGLLLILGLGALIAPFIGLLPAFALHSLGVQEAKTSLLVAAQGSGAVLAALCVGTLSARLGLTRVMSWAAGLIGPVCALYWLVPDFRTAVPVLFCLGGLYFLLTNGSQVFCQSRVPRRLQGRVSSLVSASLNGSYALGVSGLGVVGDRVGLRTAGAGAALVFGAGLVSLWPRANRVLWQPAQLPQGAVSPVPVTE